VTTSDVHSLLRWAPRSRAVIVCGELAGIGVATIERLVRQRAPEVEVIGTDAPVNGHGDQDQDLSKSVNGNGAGARSNGRLALA
jgi:hypothetical protein